MNVSVRAKTMTGAAFAGVLFCIPFVATLTSAHANPIAVQSHSAAEDTLKAANSPDDSSPAPGKNNTNDINVAHHGSAHGNKSGAREVTPTVNHKKTDNSQKITPVEASNKTSRRNAKNVPAAPPKKPATAEPINNNDQLPNLDSQKKYASSQMVVPRSPQQLAVISAFQKVLDDYQQGNINALKGETTFLANSNLNTVAPDVFISGAKADYASRGSAKLNGPLIWTTKDGKFSWVRSEIDYTQGSNTVIALFENDNGWKLATIQLV